MTDIVDFTTRKKSTIQPPPDINAEAEIENLVQMAVPNAKMVEEALGQFQKYHISILSRSRLPPYSRPTWPLNRRSARTSRA
jgi:hypothetical protein